MKLDNEDKALVLLISLSISFEHFKDVILYSKECNITLSGVQSTIRSMELSKMEDFKFGENGEGLNVSIGGMSVKETKRERN